MIVLRWDRILTLTQLMAKKSRQHVLSAVILKGRNGQTIMVGRGIANFAELTEKVATSANPVLSAHIRSKYEAGEKVVFGPITVTQQEITVRQGLTSRIVALPWSQVAEASLERNFLVIKQSGPGQNKPIAWQRIEGWIAGLHLAALALCPCPLPSESREVNSRTESEFIKQSIIIEIIP